MLYQLIPQVLVLLLELLVLLDDDLYQFLQLALLVRKHRHLSHQLLEFPDVLLLPLRLYQAQLLNLLIRRLPLYLVQ